MVKCKTRKKKTNEKKKYRRKHTGGMKAKISMEVLRTIPLPRTTDYDCFACILSVLGLIDCSEAAMIALLMPWGVSQSDAVEIFEIMFPDYRFEWGGVPQLPSAAASSAPVPATAIQLRDALEPLISPGDLAVVSLQRVKPDGPVGGGHFALVGRLADASAALFFLDSQTPSTFYPFVEYLKRFEFGLIKILGSKPKNLEALDAQRSAASGEIIAPVERMLAPGAPAPAQQTPADMEVDTFAPDIFRGNAPRPLVLEPWKEVLGGVRRTHPTSISLSQTAFQLSGRNQLCRDASPCLKAIRDIARKTTGASGHDSQQQRGAFGQIIQYFQDRQQGEAAATAAYMRLEQFVFKTLRQYSAQMDMGHPVCVAMTNQLERDRRAEASMRHAMAEAAAASEREVEELSAALEALDLTDAAGSGVRREGAPARSHNHGGRKKKARKRTRRRRRHKHSRKYRKKYRMNRRTRSSR